MILEQCDGFVWDDQSLPIQHGLYQLSCDDQRVVKVGCPLWNERLDVWMKPDLNVRGLLQRHIVSLRMQYHNKHKVGSFMFGVGEFNRHGELMKSWVANVAAGLWIFTDHMDMTRHPEYGRRVSPMPGGSMYNFATPREYTMADVVHTFMLDADRRRPLSLCVWRKEKFLGKCPIPINTEGGHTFKWIIKHMTICEGVDICATPCLEPPPLGSE